MLTEPEHAHNAAIKSRPWPPSPFTLRSIRFLPCLFLHFWSATGWIFVEERSLVLVTRWLASSGFPDPDLVPAAPRGETAAKSTKQGWEKSCQQEKLWGKYSCFLEEKSASWSMAENYLLSEVKCLWASDRKIFKCQMAENQQRCFLWVASNQHDITAFWSKYSEYS